MPNIVTEATPQPDAALSYKSRKRLSAAQWAALGIDVRASIEGALADRQTLEQNLTEWNDMYEMIVSPTDFPFVNAANICVPLIPTQVESLLAYIASKAMVPRFYLVSGNTPDAAKTAALVERYYNAELRRQRGESTWYQQIVRWLHLALRDGTGYMEATWKYRKSTVKLKQRTMQTKFDEQGNPSPVLGNDGSPVFDEQEIEAEDIYNDVEMRPVGLRNLITIPASATSLQSAVAVVKVEYLYEDELNELVAAGVLDKDEVEQALSYTPTGTTELASSRQPTGTYTDGRQISLGNGQGTVTSEFFKNRGPIEVYRAHTRQFDLDGDGVCEENIVWVHATSWKMLGWMRYDYLVNLGGANSTVRPFFPFSCFERPGELLGFGVPERLAGLQNEMNAQRNQRLNEGTIRIAPPWWENRNANIEDDNFSWGPNQKIRSDAFTDIQRFEQQPIDQQAFMDENILKADALEYTGLSSMMMGASSTGRRSATEMRQQAAATSVRLDMIVMNFRFANRTLINFVHALKKNFLTTDQHFTINQNHFTLPLEVLSQDYQIDISGASDPIDASARRQEEMGAYELFMHDPDIASNPLRRYYLRRKLAETFDWADVDQIIGTEQEAQQMVQAQQAQAQMQHLAAAMQQGQPGQAGPGGAAPPGHGPPGAPIVPPQGAAAPLQRLQQAPGGQPPGAQ